MREDLRNIGLSYLSTRTYLSSLLLYRIVLYKLVIEITITVRRTYRNLGSVGTQVALRLLLFD